MFYRRAKVAGGTYFFTVNLAERKRTLLVEHVSLLRAARIGWVEHSETHQWAFGIIDGFRLSLYPSYNYNHNGYNGVGGKGIDKMIDQWIAGSPGEQ